MPVSPRHLLPFAQFDGTVAKQSIRLPSIKSKLLLLIIIISQWFKHNLQIVGVQFLTVLKATQICRDYYRCAGLGNFSAQKALIEVT